MSDTHANPLQPVLFEVKRTIVGRLVYYAHGNHGDSAWTCLKESTGFVIGLDLWIANESGRPSRLTAMRMVASARRA